MVTVEKRGQRSFPRRQSSSRLRLLLSPLSVFLSSSSPSLTLIETARTEYSALIFVVICGCLYSVQIRDCTNRLVTVSSTARPGRSSPVSPPILLSLIPSPSPPYRRPRPPCVRLYFTRVTSTSSIFLAGLCYSERVHVHARPIRIFGAQRGENRGTHT
jgi:hypothetical protein